MSVVDPALRARVAEVRGWVQELLETPGPVLVTELRCARPECPDVETVIAVMEQGAQRRWTLPYPVATLPREAVAAALAAAPDGSAP